MVKAEKFKTNTIKQHLKTKTKYTPKKKHGNWNYFQVFVQIRCSFGGKIHSYSSICSRNENGTQNKPIENQHILAFLFVFLEYMYCDTAASWRDKWVDSQSVNGLIMELYQFKEKREKRNKEFINYQLSAWPSKWFISYMYEFRTKRCLHIALCLFTKYRVSTMTIEWQI